MKKKDRYEEEHEPAGRERRQRINREGQTQKGSRRGKRENKKKRKRKRRQKRVKPLGFPHTNSPAARGRPVLAEVTAEPTLGETGGSEEEALAEEEGLVAVATESSAASASGPTRAGACSEELCGCENTGAVEEFT